VALKTIVLYEQLKDYLHKKALTYPVTTQTSCISRSIPLKPIFIVVD